MAVLPGNRLRKTAMVSCVEAEIEISFFVLESLTKPLLQFCSRCTSSDLHLRVPGSRQWLKLSLFVMLLQFNFHGAFC